MQVYNTAVLLSADRFVRHAHDDPGAPTLLTYDISKTWNTLHMHSLIFVLLKISKAEQSCFRTTLWYLIMLQAYLWKAVQCKLYSASFVLSKLPQLHQNFCTWHTTFPCSPGGELLWRTTIIFSNHIDGLFCYLGMWGLLPALNGFASTAYSFTAGSKQPESVRYTLLSALFHLLQSQG